MRGLVWLIGVIGFIAISVSTVLLAYVSEPGSTRYWVGVAIWPLIFVAALLCAHRRARSRPPEG